MDLLTIPAALTIVGSISAIGLTIIKIVAIKSSDNKNNAISTKELDVRLDEINNRVTILEVKSQENDRNIDRFDNELEKIDRLNETLIKFFSDTK